MDKAISKKPSRRTRILQLSVLSCIVLSVLFVFYGFRGKELKVQAEHLHVQEVVFGAFQEYIPLNGIVEPIKTIYIDVVQGGKVEEIFIEDGREISEGTSIIRLSNQQFQMDAINREAQLLDQQNNLRNTRIQMDQQTSTLRDALLRVDYDLAEAERDYQINERLFNDSAIAKVDFQKSREKLKFLRESRRLNSIKVKTDSVFRMNQMGQIDESLSLVSRNLQFLDESVENLVVKAPITGILSQLQVDLGQNIVAGARIGQIDVMDKLKIRSSVAEHYASRVAPGLQAVFMLDGKEYVVEVSKVYPEISNGQFNIDLLFLKETPQSIRRGQTLQIKLALGEKGEALQIPRGPYYQQTGGNWIFVLNTEGEAVRRAIKLGRQNADYYEVLEGLYEGEKVITSRYDLFGEAETLRITP